MSWRWILLLVLAVAVVPAGSPVDVSYVTSDSMDPTLRTGDGYLLVPAGQIQADDIVTYRAPGSDGLVTHRVVEVTDAGLVTKGDGNEVTDQATGDPPIRESAVVGQVLSIAGFVVRIPGLGPATTVLHQHLAAALVIAAVGLGLVERRGGQQPVDRRLTRAGDVVAPLLLALGVFAVVMVLVATSSHSLAFVAMSEETDAPRQLTVGEPATKPVVLSGTSPPFTDRVVSAERMDIQSVEQRSGQLRLSVAVPPAEHPGRYTARVRVHHYPATLPAPVLRGAHAIHPLLAAVGSVGALFGPLVIVALLFVDGQRLLRLPRSHRLRRLFD